MQVSRFLRASVFIAAVTLAVPALAFGGHGGGGGGHGGGFGGGGFHGGGFGGGGFHGGGGGWHGGGGGGWHGGGSWRGAGWHGGYGGWGYPAYGYGYPYGFDDGYDWGYDYGDPGYDYGYDNGYGVWPRRLRTRRRWSKSRCLHAAAASKRPARPILPDAGKDLPASSRLECRRRLLLPDRRIARLRPGHALEPSIGRMGLVWRPARRDSARDTNRRNAARR